ncbi:MAG: alpha/beta fold hydrolase, partial [Leucothrix sp.]
LALIATTPAFGGRDDSFKQQFLADRLKPLDNGLTLADLAPKFVPQIVGSIASDAVIQAATQTMSRVPDESYRAILRCLVTFNRYADTAKITQPSIVIAGSEDTNAPAPTMQKMASKLPNAQFHEIQGAGHLVNMEAANTCNQRLKTFYKEQHKH